MPGKGKNNPQDMQEMRPLMQMVFHCADKVRRIRLSREVRRNILFITIQVSFYSWMTHPKTIPTCINKQYKHKPAFPVYALTLARSPVAT